MKLILIGGACLCGLSLVIKLATGTVDPMQVAGVGIVLAALAQLAP